jgi:NADH-ubiquinone oxidoreductase chain 4
MGSYGLIKFCVELMPYGSNYYRPIIYLISIISIIYSSLSTIRQIDLKRIIAYSSIGHMGIINIGIFSNTLIGIAGSIILIIAHGLTSSGLFICIGSLYSKYHTRSIMYFKGLTSIMPILSSLFFLLLLGNMGTPLTSNFIGELMCFIGSLKGSTLGITIIGTLSIILSASYNI